MTEIGLTVACWDYDRTRALLDGRVGVDGCRVIPVTVGPEDAFPRAVSRAEFDVSELSLSSYLLQLTRGDCPYVAIPVFLSRGFKHDCYYVRADAGIKTPKDLEGKRVGVPEYQMTLALWGRGILQDDYGVDFRKLRYRTGGLNPPGRKERLPLRLPDHMDVMGIGPKHSLNEMLLSGELEAIMSPGPPKAFSDGNPKVRRLIADPHEAERAYFARTGIFPILHVAGIRRELVDAHPWLPEKVYAAFVAAKKIAMAEIDAVANAGANKVTLPWFAAEVARTKALMGDDYWPYGVAANRAALEAVCRYSHEQYLSERPLAVGDLFAASTVALAG